MSTSREHTANDPLQSYQQRAADAHLTPLWSFFKEWFSAEPRSAAVPHVWRYDALRSLLMEAAGVISAADAERRVLALENPGLQGQHLATDALYAGLQLIMPGEFAPTHRHTSAALRLVLEGADTYTAVAGEKCYMRPGDFIVTPGWAWHEHRNEGSGPTIWLDVLDVPVVRYLGAGFSEHYPETEFPVKTPPAANQRDRATTATVFSYPYEQAYARLDHLRHYAEWDPCHGLRTEYIDPATGGPAIPTISTFLQLVPRGFATQPYRTTASSVMTAIAGHGRVTLGRGDHSREIAFGPRDLWSVPSWQPLTITADEECVLFSASTEALQRKLGLWREQRGDQA